MECYFSTKGAVNLMINELYRLAVSMQRSSVETESWHREYMPIPNISPKAPCVRIVIDKKRIVSLESVTKESAGRIRKFGSNQGTFPAMNLVPLYRLSDSKDKQELSALLSGKEEQVDIHRIRSWCTVKNWDKKTLSRYEISAVKMPVRIKKLLSDNNVAFSPFDTLLEEFSELSDASILFSELKKHAFSLLESRKDIILALQILFYSEKEPDKNGKRDDKTSNLSVVFDAEKLIDDHCAVISDRFTKGLNSALQKAEVSAAIGKEKTEIDAFGQPFAPLNEPMPKVKLAAGFDVSLRTMFEGQPCQKRYGGFGGDTYPISRQLRNDLQSALDWIGKAEHERIYWIRTDKNEALFAYPKEQPEQQISFVAPYLKLDGSATFEAAAKSFLKEIEYGKKSGTDSAAQPIQLFILRKIDKARTKVVYSYNTSPMEIEMRAGEWSEGCCNLPLFPFGQPETVFPLNVSDTLNQFWKQDGSLATDKFRPIQTYHGMELLFGQAKLAQKDLSALIRNLFTLQPALQSEFYKNSKSKMQQYVTDSLALLGLFLLKSGYRKEKYMEEFPYLLGQLLKISDSLHEMYCKVVRDGSVPPQLAGSSLYSAAAEQPSRTLAQLGQRMNPYITWAKSYRTKGINIKDKESGVAGWYLYLFETIATRLSKAWNPQSSFSDEQKAALFIGYLAAFPKKENKTNDMGGTENE